ncbi:MAG: DegT/DnrJ/EryC1/StrS family aminotransferase [Peptococcaceae bacterium]|nr:DegT/DnrJ/EryC1/StrS family aminotransferase [Peptococcaceae bacterium]
MQIPLLDLKAQYALIKDEIDAAVHRVLESCHFILGPEGRALEEEMASFCETQYAIGVANGTDALTLALLALNIRPGDEVITTPYTFFATAETVAQLGAVPVFVDIDPVTLNLDLNHIKIKITARTKAIIPVHIFGQMLDVERLTEVADRYEISILEDAAQAVGARYRGRRAGSLGHAGTLSFFPTKNLGAYGDAGMVVTNDARIAEVVRRLRFHGCDKKYYHDDIGYNSRLDEIQAAILRVKLRYLEQWNEARRVKAARYDLLLADAAGRGDIVLPGRDPEAESVYHLYVVRSRRREEIMKALAGAGIGSAVYYPVPLHLQKAFEYLGMKPGSLPVAEGASEEAFALPCYPELTDEQQERVVEIVEKALYGVI